MRASDCRGRENVQERGDEVEQKKERASAKGGILYNGGVREKEIKNS